MSDTAIKVENLSKRYRIGLEEEIPDTFVSAATSFLASPLRNFRRLRALSRFDENDQRSNVQTFKRSNEDIIWALRDISFEVERGEVVGVIGRNGAGKSTLLKILSRITHPTSGRVELNGRVSSLLEVGTGFHQELTGRENIYLNGTILGMTKAEVDRKFDEIVDFSGVEKFIDTPVKRYSSGMRVRLAFSVAAYLEPEILLIDEVLAVGDVNFQKKCLGKMQDVATKGRTVLFVSHNMAAIQQLCSSAMWIETGKLGYRGDVDTCISRYLHTDSDIGVNSILSHADYRSSDVVLSQVTVNESTKDTQVLKPNCRQLDIVVSGETRKPMRLFLEARLFDHRDQCLAFFTPRRNRESFDIIPIGKFQLSESIGLPHMNQGDFLISINVARLELDLKNPVHIPRAVRLEVEGTPTITGWVFKYARGNGWMLLPSICDEV